jgi:glutathione peroxidase-family protein/uncharacterized membrane protein
MLICIANDLITSDKSMKTSILQNIFRVILGLLMVLAGIGHLTFQRQEFLAQVPRWLPSDPAFMDFIVLSSGIVEILLGLGMVLLTKHKVKIGLLLALFYVLIFPGNISQYTNGIDAFGLDTDQKRLIRLFFQPVLILWALWSTGALAYLIRGRKEQKEAKSQSFYDFGATDIRGQAVKMDAFRGKTVIVVNTASKCGLTPQYEGLEALHNKYKDKGLVILGFPCNQFANQETGTSEEIEAFCQVNYGVNFPIFSKIDVNGEKAHPLFRFLKARLGGYFGSQVKWNFTKFVIDKKGMPVKRFSPLTKPESMEAFIQKLL